MLNLLNNNNLSLLDHNLLTLGLVIGGVSILGFLLIILRITYTIACLKLLMIVEHKLKLIM